MGGAAGLLADGARALLLAARARAVLYPLLYAAKTSKKASPLAGHCKERTREKTLNGFGGKGRRGADQRAWKTWPQEGRQ